MSWNQSGAEVAQCQLSNVANTRSLAEGAARVEKARFAEEGSGRGTDDCRVCLTFPKKTWQNSEESLAGNW